MNLKNRVAVAAGLLVAAGASMAQTTPTIDVSGVTPIFVGAGVAFTTMGTAYLVMRYGGKVWKWLANL